jgi:hypothetical protein
VGLAAFAVLPALAGFAFAGFAFLAVFFGATAFRRFLGAAFPFGDLPFVFATVAP